jgi:DNA ligase-4
MDISFESCVCSLIYRLSHPPRSKSSSSLDPLPPSKIFQSWLNHLPRLLLPGTGKRLFRLLFPHEGPRRRYGLKETRLGAELERVLGVDGIKKWDELTFEGEGGTGCLGKEVELIMKDRVRLPCSSSSFLHAPLGLTSVQMTSGRKSSMSLSQLDTLLDELAASSPFSQLSITPTDSRPQSRILNVLFRDSSLSPYAAAVLTQIILRDLRPLLIPLPRLPIRNPTALLRLKSNAGPAQLELMDAMRVWDPRMPELYVSGVGRIDRCADLVETFGAREGPAAGLGSGPGLGPSIGVTIPVRTTNAVWPRSCTQCP